MSLKPGNGLRGQHSSSGAAKNPDTFRLVLFEKLRIDLRDIFAGSGELEFRALPVVHCHDLDFAQCGNGNRFDNPTGRSTNTEAAAMQIDQDPMLIALGDALLWSNYESTNTANLYGFQGDGVTSF